MWEWERGEEDKEGRGRLGGKLQPSLAGPGAAHTSLSLWSNRLHLELQEVEVTWVEKAARVELLLKGVRVEQEEQLEQRQEPTKGTSGGR